MSDEGRPDSLSTTRHFVLVLRLVLAPGERLVHGYVVDPETRSSTPFVGLNGLSRVVDRWVANARGAVVDEAERNRPD